MCISQWRSAQGAPRPEALIKWRQSAYQVIAWNSGRIKAALAGQYDAREVQARPTRWPAVANSGPRDAVRAGTADGKGWRETTARDEVFSDAAEVPCAHRGIRARGQRAGAPRRRRAIAQAVNAQFLKVAQACKACHDKFRQTD